MKQITVSAQITVFENTSELPEAILELMKAAVEIRKKAYAPYSGFRVGAALLMEDGTVVVGNNQENADFTDGLCAERVALFYAHAKFPKVSVVAIAVSAKNHNGLVKEPAQPCRSCRQVMVEFGVDMVVIITDQDGNIANEWTV